MNAFHSPRAGLAAPAIAAALAQNGIPVYGQRPANLRRFHTALAKLRAGTYRPKVVFVGDSKTVGAGAGATPTSGAYVYTDGAESLSKVAHVVRALSDRGLAASRQSWFGSKSLPTAAALNAYDARLSGLSGWTGGVPSLGGVMWSSGGTTSLTFAPQGTVDTFDVYTKLHAGDGTLTVTADADSTVLATINGSAGGEGFKKTTVTTTRGTHAVNVQRTAGGYASVAGIIARDSTVPAIDVINAGAFGTVSAYHTSTAGVWSASNAFATLLPDLVLIQLGSNDLNTTVDVSVFAANIQDIVTKAQAAGADVVLEVPTFGNTGGYGTDAQRETYRQALIGLGAANGCMVVDHAARFVSYANANALGLMRDAIHETAPGYADEAQALVSALVF